MSKRQSTIALSETERQLLKDARVELLGTDEVPYGVAIQRLVGDATSIDVDAAVAAE